MSELFQDKKFKDTARQLLIETDKFAARNVQLGLGGPFGASIHIYNRKTGEFILIGTLQANAVLSTGLAGAHAEDQAMKPEQILALKAKLAAMADDIDDLFVLLSSSGESCPSCHSKEQILARDLVYHQLIKSGHFIVTYGATYQDTAEIAGFHDLPYFIDIQKPRGTGAIPLLSSVPSELPKEFSYLFSNTDQPLAVLVTAFGTFTGGDLRTPDHLFINENLRAIYAANTALKQMNADAPWDVGLGQSGLANRSALYTTDTDIGPLVYSTAQWANVGKLVSVECGVHSSSEAAGITDGLLYKVVGNQDYSHTASEVHIVHIDNFPNMAQYEWRERLQEKGDAILYNGAQVK